MIVVHAKQTRDSVWCGKNILGKITDAEGNMDGHYEVTCKECLIKKEKARINRHRLHTEEAHRKLALRRLYQRKNTR